MNVLLLFPFAAFSDIWLILVVNFFHDIQQSTNQQVVRFFHRIILRYYPE